MSKAIKLLLTELVGQYRNILPLAFSALASHSVNKSVLLRNYQELIDRSFEVLPSQDITQYSNFEMQYHNL